MSSMTYKKCEKCGEFFTIDKQRYTSDEFPTRIIDERAGKFTTRDSYLEYCDLCLPCRIELGQDIRHWLGIKDYGGLIHE